MGNGVKEAKPENAKLKVKKTNIADNLPLAKGINSRYRISDELKYTAEIAGFKKITYRAVTINTQAKKLWAEVQKANEDLQEKLQAIDARLDELRQNASPANSKQRHNLLEKRNQILHNCAVNLATLHHNLSIIEKDLYPERREEQVFYNKKQAASELYVSLKNQVSALRFQLLQCDASTQKMLDEDLKQLELLLSQTNLISQEMEKIARNSEHRIITKEIYTHLANLLYELNDQAFAVTQICKLIEDRLTIITQDQTIAEKTTILQNIYNNLEATYQLVVTHRQHGTLSDRFKELLVNENYHFKLTFSADSFKPTIPVTTLHWSDNASQRTAVKTEREQLLRQLKEKEQVAQELVKVIVEYQKTLKEAIGEDLEYCLQRAALETAFGKRNSLPYYLRLKESINFNFQMNVDKPEFIVHLNHLLMNASAVTSVQMRQEDLKSFQETFLRDFPELFFTDNHFTYKGERYPRQESWNKTLNDYHIAQQRIKSAFAHGDAKTRYAAINYTAELVKLHDSRAAIEEFIENYTKERRQIAKEVQALQEQLIHYPLIPIENHSFTYASTAYPLLSIKATVESYNLTQQTLTTNLAANLSTMTPVKLSQLQNNLKILEENKKAIAAYVQHQNWIKELRLVSLKLKQHENLLEPKIKLADKICQRIEEEITRIEKNNPQDERIAFLKKLKIPFIEVTARLTSAKERIEEVLQAKRDTTNLKQQLTTAKGFLAEMIGINQETLQYLDQSVKEQLSATNLSKLTDSIPILKELFQFIETKLIQPLHKLLTGSEKAYQPGLFASKAEKNLHAFKRDIIPEIEELQKQQRAAPAA
ncbi:hypothetical protein [Legionella clemsonensis]|uniref:Uncharacterized protein n=1 Tax=Legionella clemsonensis TaxID=1867846 RepID=A0A222NYG4_9GAMM|nr:hypothetical protein [Legionella clemsonensis]ASQ44632.1 hypothetical protein clem_00330 [Legionella clemsonensis]